MTGTTREEILDVLAIISQHEPEVRFGQLVANLSYLAKGVRSEAVWDVTDEEFLAAARQHLANRQRKLSQAKT